MKVILTSQGDSLDAAMDVRFGRAAKFLLWDSSTQAVSVVDNQQSMDAPQGAGIQAAMTAIKQGANAVITSHCGPKAFRVLESAGVRLYLGVQGRVSEALEQLKAGALKEAAKADVEGHWA